MTDNSLIKDPLVADVVWALNGRACGHEDDQDLCHECLTGLVGKVVADWRTDAAEQISSLSMGVPEPENGGYLDGYDDAVELAASIVRGGDRS